MTRITRDDKGCLGMTKDDQGCPGITGKTTDD